ncbi:MAG: O-antigen ligase family protein [Alteraurantiacibacter sp. bin_em_oilr2.035]|nr:O-antigen ligase family protein [Alteraurantiacibacter sp. bin_em_oilr2.035]
MSQSQRTAIRASSLNIDRALFAVMLFLVALLGGSSRYDLVQVAPLQFSLWFLLGIALARSTDFGEVRPLVILSLLYVVWLLLQIIPLPHGAWTYLPGREAVEAVEVALAEHHSRPVSLAPGRTFNALGYAPVFLLPLVLAVRLGDNSAKFIMGSVVTLALVSALLGILQDRGGVGYFYATTSVGKPVGLFANTNHYAVYGAFVLSLCAFLFVRATGFAKGAVALASGLLFISVLSAPSRAGFACLLIAAACWLSLGLTHAYARGRRDAKPSWRMLAVCGLGLGLTALLGTFVFFGRASGLARILSDDPFADLRIEIFPVIIAMIRDFLPIGAGVGSFEDVFYIYEGNDILQADYVNMAHNDLLQVIVEGGVFPLVFVAALLVVTVRAMRRKLVDYTALERFDMLALVATLAAILLVSSAVDYPLRTPLFQMTVALFFVPLICFSAPSLRAPESKSTLPSRLMTVTSGTKGNH